MDAEGPRRRTWIVTAVVAALLAGAAAFLMHGAPRAPAEQATPAPAAPRSSTPAPRAEPGRARPEPSAPSPKDEAPHVLRAKKPPPRSLRLVVVTESGQPVPGATVRAWSMEGPGPRITESLTDEAGAAEVDLTRDDLRGGRLSVRKTGFRVVDVRVNDEPEMRVVLSPGIPLRGRVVLADSREPVAGVAVRAWDAERGLDEVDVPRTTDADGRFELAGVPPGVAVRIYAAKAGYRTLDTVVTRNEPGEELELLLGEGGVLEGTLTDNAGAPMPGIAVFLLADPDGTPHPEWARNETSKAYDAVRGFLFPPTLTDGEGNYRFLGVRLPVDGVPQPRYAVARRAEGVFARSEPASFTRHGEQVRRDIRFRPDPSLTVKVEGPPERVKGVEVRVHPNGGGSREMKAVLAEGESSRSFGVLKPGLWNVSAGRGELMDDDGWEQSQWIDLVPGTDAVVTLSAGEDRRVEGVLVDSAGAPVEGKRIEFRSSRKRGERSVEAWTTTGPAGDFVFEGLPASPGRIESEAHTLSPLHGNGVRPFADLRVEGVVPGGAPLRLVIQRAGRVVGRVVPPPARAMDLDVEAEGNDLSTSATCDAEGRFAWTANCTGPASLSLRVDGFAPAVFADVVIPPGGVLDLGEVRLDDGVAIDCVVRGPDGTPVTGGDVKFTDSWCNTEGPIDRDGRLRVRRLPARPLHVLVATPSHPHWRLVVEPGPALREIVLGRAAKCTGTVSGSVPHGAQVWFTRAPERGVGGGPTRTALAADGTFRASLQPGRWSAEVRNAGFEPIGDPVEFEVSEDKTTVVALAVR